MHELGITRNIVSICSEQAHGRKVTRVRLEVGLLSGVVPDAIRFCFDVCSQGTPLEGADLEVLEIPGEGECRSCGKRVALQQVFEHCACGAGDLICVAGKELNIKDMEVQ